MEREVLKLITDKVIGPAYTGRIPGRKGAGDFIVIVRRREYGKSI